jgi:hypothetical protein
MNKESIQLSMDIEEVIHAIEVIPNSDVCVLGYRPEFGESVRAFFRSSRPALIGNPVKSDSSANHWKAHACYTESSPLSKPAHP